VTVEPLVGGVELPPTSRDRLRPRDHPRDLPAQVIDRRRWHRHELRRAPIVAADEHPVGHQHMKLRVELRAPTELSAR
jgi:hypothetical protein